MAFGVSFIANPHTWFNHIVDPYPKLTMKLVPYNIEANLRYISASAENWLMNNIQVP
jgi:hypothetical protein